jgi:hypothetical protein
MNLFGKFNLACILFAALVASGCATAPAPESADAALQRETIVWSGEVFIEETTTFKRGTRLVIEPGTTVRFADTDEDGDGWGDVSLKFEGELIAKGTLDAPILFTSKAAVAQPGMWGELRIDFGKVDVSYAVFEGSTRGLHLHFTGGKVEDSIFRDNVDGTRLGESRLEFTRCLFTGNSGKGFNARASTISLTRSWFRGNRKGIFFFEGDKGSDISQNLFTDNETPVRLGDFYAGTV